MADNEANLSQDKPVPSMELMAFLAQNKGTRLRYVGPPQDPFAATAPRGVWKKLWARLFQRPPMAEVFCRAITLADLHHNDALRFFIVDHPDLFEVVAPQPQPVFLHLYYDCRAEFQFELSTLSWEELRVENLAVLEHAEYVASKILWSPLEMETPDV